MTYTVAAFYKFITIPDCVALRAVLLEVCRAGNIVGSILVAPEGVNGTIAGRPSALDSVFACLESQLNLPAIEVKRSTCGKRPFPKLKVRLKREIVTLRKPEANPAVRVGTYVEPADWNALMADPDVVVIDTRNAYEVGIGTFPGALDPKTEAFGEFPAFIQQALPALQGKKVAMFCTGGIRCEKASSYLMGLGLPEVYHLKGGILKYLEVVPEAESLWQGECYVFDDRVSVTHGLREGSYEMCFSCGEPMLDGGPCRTCEGRAG